MPIITFLIFATISDLYNRTIPNTLLIPMFLVALWLQQNNLSIFFIALITSSAIILLLYKLKFFAGGDAKLLVILGAFTGSEFGYGAIIFLFLFTFLIGGLQALFYKYFLKQSSLPYALSILVGYVSFLIYNFENVFNPILTIFKKTLY